MTYIEKPKYYERNRVFVVSRKTTEYIIGSWIDLDTWRRHSSRILRKEFNKRFEVSPLQFK